jgi:hypothetical protein
MSFTENDRKIRSESGNSFPGADRYAHPPFAQAIATALRAEFGGGPSAVKTAARLTQTNERTARNWFEAKNAPSGEHLITLLKHSNLVLGAVLDLADRRDLRVASNLIDFRQQLLDLVTAIDTLKR